MYDKADNQETIEPPRYDTLIVRFRGDSHEISLPYIEVANGDIVDLSDTGVEVAMTKNGIRDSVRMTFSEFAQVVESSFDTKEITKLSLQMAGKYEQVQIV